MSEAKLERAVLALLRARGAVHKHRDLTAGVPDISFTVRTSGGIPLDGWAELKYLREPSRASVTELRLDGTGHGRGWTAGQRFWLRQRGEAGGSCYLILQVGSIVHVIWWRDALALFPSAGPGPTAYRLAADFKIASELFSDLTADNLVAALAAVGSQS